jgi:hypothetical protein
MKQTKHCACEANPERGSFLFLFHFSFTTVTRGLGRIKQPDFCKAPTDDTRTAAISGLDGLLSG